MDFEGQKGELRKECQELEEKKLAVELEHKKLLAEVKDAQDWLRENDEDIKNLPDKMRKIQEAKDLLDQRQKDLAQKSGELQT